MVQKLDTPQERAFLHYVDNLPAERAFESVPPSFADGVLAAVWAVVAAEVEVETQRAERPRGGQKTGNVDLCTGIPVTWSANTV